MWRRAPKSQISSLTSDRLTAAIALALAVMIPAAQAEFLTLGDLAGGAFQSVAYGVNANGTVVVGRSTSANGTEAFRWTQGGGMVGLGDLPGGAFSSWANGVNADGSVVIGNGTTANGTEAFRWTQGGGMVGLGDLPGGVVQSVANGVNADGSVVVGYSQSANGGEAFRWTQGGGMVGLGDLPGLQFYSQAYGVNADGSMVVGRSTSANGGEAFRWTQGGGMVGLGDLPGGPFDSTAYNVNADGSVIIGNGTSANGTEAFRWTQGGGMVGLGDLPGGVFSSVAYGLNSDGSVLVGNSTSTNGVEAFRWTQSTGMQTLTQWLTDAGVSVAPGFTFQTARGVSDDGSVIVGFGPNASGYTEAFLIRVVSGNGSGAISLDGLSVSLAETSSASELALIAGDLVLNGGHSRPLSRRVSEGQKCVWVMGDWGENNHNARDGKLGLAEIGGCHNFGSFQANLSVGETWAEQNLSQNGDINTNNTYLMAEMLVPLDSQLWASFGALYQWGEADIKRGYLNAGLPDKSSGSPNVEIWAVRARLDWDGAGRFGNASISPYADLSHRESQQDGYIEVGGSFPARFNANTIDATEIRLGVNASKPMSNITRLLGQLEGVHRFSNDGIDVSGNVIGLFDFDFSGSPAKQDWLRMGVGVEHDTTGGKFSLMLNGTTMGEEPNVWLAASYQMIF